MQYDEVMARLRALANADNVAGMARYGIRPQTETLGISVYTVREIAKDIKRDHALALQLWDSGVHEARLLAGIIADPGQMTPAEMDRWAAAFDSWDIVDQTTSNLFDKTPYAYQKALEWAGREEEFVRRAAYALIAALAVQDKQAPDSAFEAFFPVIVSGATDERNFVKKAVNWALRNIGKRSQALNASAIALAREIQTIPAKSARWIASDALRELTSDKAQARLARRK
ncbi:MAG: DNA alkylation repair protein [Anaerolineae bacterium]|nr:DNA alkylation repair protein [Anaerolineae bacterium]